MLFSNFLCLFYLMLLTDGHTISKIINHKTTYDIVDSAYDIYRRETKPKHDQVQHNYRREENNEASKVLPVTEELKDNKVTTEVTTRLVKVKSTKKRGKNNHFWNKFRHRNNEKIKAHKSKRAKSKHRVKDTSDVDSYSANVRSRRNRRRSRIKKIKRDVTLVGSPKTTTPENESVPQSSSDFESTVHNSIATRKAQNLGPIKFYQPYMSTKNISKSLTDMTTQLLELKEAYSKPYTRMSQTPVTSTMLKNLSYSRVTTPYNSDFDLLGTSQIEALLNEIKMNAIKMAVEQNPAITDMISNTVTETTFEADPILTHLDISTPGYALSTYISVDIPNSKRTVDSNETVVIADGKPMHSIAARSIEEEAYTIAHNIEDMLQKNLKKVYKKVKNKLSSDLRHEMHDVTSTMKKKYSKVIDKITQIVEKSTIKTTRPIKKVNTNLTTKGLKKILNSKQPRHAKSNRTKSKTTLTTEATYDYMMLTLFEQILAKTHQDNVMNMLATTSMPFGGDDTHSNYRRDVKSSSGLDDENNVTMPEDYSSSGVPDVDVSINADGENFTTTDAAEDTSYEGLSNKISFDDYVNGYKHYLNFQKEQGQENFSDLVRYQAHRHHSVDDIGKYILNKIPQLPATRLKRYFDDDNIEYQEASTKSDESWFRKHFYFFIDHGPPRKFHTSQTVALKVPISHPNSRVASGKSKVRSEDFITSTVSVNGHKDNEEDPVDNNLEELSKILYEKTSNAMYPYGRNSESSPTQSQSTYADRVIDSGDVEDKSTVTRNFLAKLFNERRPKPAMAAKDDKGHKRELEPHSQHHILDRNKRNNKHTEQYKVFDDSLITVKSTALHDMIETKNKNYGYVDVNLIPRPTAIIKLRDNRVKNGKIKKFFNKFHFRKHKKPQSKVKRECRHQRFNPLKALKNIFNKPKMKVTKAYDNIDSGDYEMITSHIDTFKAVKYDTILSPDEINRLIPNITADIESSIEKPKSYKNKPSVQESNSVHPGSSFTQDIPSAVMNHVYGTKLPATKGHQTKTTKKKESPKTTTKRYQMKTFSLPHHVYNTIDEIFFETSTPEFEHNLSGIIYNANQVTTLEDIRKELNNIEMNLSVPSMEPTLTETSSHITRVSPQRIYVPPHLQTAAKEPINNINIQKKLTRISKFPTSQNSHGDTVKIAAVTYQSKKNYDNTRDSIDKVDFKRGADTDNLRPSSTQSNIYFKKYAKVNYKRYPDYFNDLLLWHSDVLNTDKVTSSVWNILKSYEDIPEITTQSMSDMERELKQMNEFIRLSHDVTTKGLNIHKSVDKVRSNPDRLQYVVRALKDDPLAKSDQVMIKGEAKYLQVYKEPINLGHYLKTGEVIGDNRQLQYKTPFLRNHSKLRNGKRNDGNRNENLVETPYAYRDADLKSSTLKPVTKMNQSPMQYFITPFPMNMSEFNNFLKENNIDVLSVTKPLTGAPEMSDLYPKMATIDDKKAKTEKVETHKIKYSESVPLSYVKTNNYDFEEVSESIHKSTTKRSVQNYNDNIYDEIDKTYYSDVKDNRYKRNSEIIDSRFYLKSSTGKPKRRIFKKKIKLFDKTSSSASPFVDNIYTDETQSDNDDSKVELTIIDMDDTSEQKAIDTVNKKPNVRNRTSKTKSQNANVSEAIRSSKYNHKKVSKENLITTKAMVKNNLSVAPDVRVAIVKSSTPFQQLIGTDFFHKLHGKSHHPKRVHISSHSYKYDVVYDHKNKLRNKRNLSHHIASTLPTTVNETQWNNDSEDQIIRVVQAVEAVMDFTRPSVAIHVDLPTYYMPYTGPTEPMVTRRPNSVWNEYVLKYLSGLALVELLSKFRFIKPADTKTNSTGGQDETVNAYKVFSDPAMDTARCGGALEGAEVKRHSRQVLEHGSEQLDSKSRKAREKRRLKLFSHIKGKLMKLMGKTPGRHKSSSPTALKTTSSSKEHATPSVKEMIRDYREGKRREIEMTTEVLVSTNEVAFDYGFDIDKMIMGRDVDYLTTKKTTKETNLASDQVYFEPSLSKNKTKTTKTVGAGTEMKVGKRDISSPEIYTAKDVAAIEVIVDLVRNKADPDYDLTSEGCHNTVPPATSTSNPATSNPNPNTNAIQVHIAVPYNLMMDRKRSLDFTKVRRVFAAKMLKPVDMEYQVQSFTNPKDSATTHSGEPDLKSAKMYLLVDSNGTLPQGSFALQPVEANTDSTTKVRSRQADASTVTEQNSEPTTATASLENMTLSKEFIAAVNKHLIQLYETLKFDNDTTARHNVKVRKTESLEQENKAADRRHINWDAVKKYFGRGRVGRCQCRANRTMCRACAASDAVISELIFEFDNLANYMKEHCTEIQTFFSMNPLGGKQLTDSVHRVDQTIHDYYKRVKGKCHGRTCKPCSQCIDKRSLIKHKKYPKKKYIGRPLIYDLQKLSDDIFTASKYNMCCNSDLIANDLKMEDAIKDCVEDSQLRKKFVSKPDKKKPVVTNVYSLDNINVNIICNPEDSAESFKSETTMASSIKPDLVLYNFTTSSVPFDYDINLHESSTSGDFRRLFSQDIPPNAIRNMFTYYVTKDNATSKPYNVFHKREAQPESPLVADAGGMFWNNYIKDRQSERKSTTFEVSEKTNSFEESTTELDKLNHPLDINTTDESIETLSYNINELFKIFHNLTDLNDVKKLSKNSQKHSKSSKKPTTKTTLKTSRHTTKIFKGLKDKLHFKHRPNTPLSTQSSTKATPTTKTNEKSSSTANSSCLVPKLEKTTSMSEISKVTPSTTIITDKRESTKTDLKETLTKSKITAESLKVAPTTVKGTMKSDSLVKEAIEDKALTKSTESGKSKSGFFDKLKSVTRDFFHVKNNGDSKTDKRLSRSFTKPSSSNTTTETAPPTTDSFDNNINVISNATTTSMTILILNDYNDDSGSTNNFEVNSDNLVEDVDDSISNSLLLSILDYERKKLDSEWSMYKKEDERSLRTAKGNNGGLFPSLTTQRSSSTTATNKELDYDILKDTKDALGGLELPTPPGLETEKKADGLIQKIVHKFGVKVTPTPKQAATRTQASQATAKLTTSEQPKQQTKDDRKHHSNNPNPVRRLCDVEATLKHLLEIKRKTPKADFEELASNVTCFKYKKSPVCFILKYRSRTKTKHSPIKEVTRLRWDWIRRRRSVVNREDVKRANEDLNDNTDIEELKLHHKHAQNHDLPVTASKEIKSEKPSGVFNNDNVASIFDKDIKFIVEDGNEDFETFVKDSFGIYSRRKRSPENIEELTTSFKRLPFHSKPGETYVLLGDPLVIQCSPHTPEQINSTSWQTDRKEMLLYSNVAVGDSKVTIRSVTARNQGGYICKRGNAPQKSVNLTVIALPTYDIVSSAVYSVSGKCGYDDLKAVRALEAGVRNECCPLKDCGVTIEDPICLGDQAARPQRLRVTVTVSVPPRGDGGCSARCRRDLHASIALLVAGNVAVVTTVPVLISNGNINKTLTPTKAKIETRWIVTHTIRKKDSVGHPRRHSHMSGDWDGVVVVPVCSPGFYLIAEQGICAACPSGSWSKRGQNSCHLCPRGTHSIPGEDSCRLNVIRMKRYRDWWPWSCAVAAWSWAVAVACAGAAIASAFRRRDSAPGLRASAPAVVPRAQPRARPLSPSRVILAKLFRGSRSSTRATDSQETKFGLWKERNKPPPLPPIDFDL